jgi:hypothetical protein
MSNKQIGLKPQDLVVLLKLVAKKGGSRSYAELSSQLGLSASEVHASVKRSQMARLIIGSEQDELWPSMPALREFVLYGAKYAFPTIWGSATRGTPTSYAAPPLASQITAPNEPPPVWPSPHGIVRGLALYPLYPTVPIAAEQDEALYELLALFDAIRSGAARERELASALLQERIQ